MTNYAIEKYATPIGSITDVAAAMETLIETVVNSKTIRYYAILPYGSGSFIGVIHYDT